MIRKLSVVLLACCFVAGLAPHAIAQRSAGGFRIAGFDVTPNNGIVDAKSRNGSGVAIWPGGNGEIPVTIQDVVVDPRTGSPVSGRVISTKTVKLTLSGHEFVLSALELTPLRARGSLAYRPPGSVERDLDEIELGSIDIEPDGTFSVRRTVTLAPGISLKESTGSAVRFAGSEIVVEPLKGKSGAQELSVEFLEPMVRVPIVAPFEKGTGRDLFLTEAPSRAYLFGIAERLKIDPDGALRAETVTVVPSQAAPGAWSRNADPIIPLFLPAGFGLEPDGGTISLVAGKVGTVDLRGRIHLPAEFDSPPLAFSHLQRSGRGSGFETEILDDALPRLLIEEYSYRPSQAQFLLPGPLPAGGRGSALDTGPIPTLPTDLAGLQAFEAATRARLGDHGLVVWGGVLAAPWSVTRPPKASQTKAPPPAPPTAPPRPGTRQKGGFLTREQAERDRLQQRLDPRTDLLLGTGSSDSKSSDDKAGRTGPTGDLFENSKTGTSRTTTTPKTTTPKTATESGTRTETGIVKTETAPKTQSSTSEAGSQARRSRFVPSGVTSRGAPRRDTDDIPFVVDTGHRNRSPRAEAARSAAARAAGGVGVNGTNAAQTPAQALLAKNLMKGNVQYPLRHALQAGAFRIGSGGVEGRWAMMQDPETRSIGKFKAQVDRTYLAFSQSTVVNSAVRGRLLIPYPTSLEIPFEGTLTASGEVLVPEDGLEPPAMAGGWYLDYWKMSVFPQQAGIGVGTRGVKTPTTAAEAEKQRVQENAASTGQIDLTAPTSGGRTGGRQDSKQPGTGSGVPTVVIGIQIPIFTPPPPLVFNQDRILVASAGMRPDVDSAHGGMEFSNKNGDTPFEMSFSILPDGNLREVDVRPVDAGGIEFLGIPFHPYRSTIQLRRYVGKNEPPPADAPRHPGWLMKMEGKLAFSFFGDRKVRIQHTAMGARVPFIEPSAKDENGRPAPILADSGGALYVDARLRFVNTFGMPENMIRRRFPPNNVDPNRPFEPDGGDNLAVEPFKAFIGEAKIELLGALSVNGLAEAGQWMRENGELNGYEKIGAGGGVDVVRAVLAAVRGMETVAQLGGGVVEIATGAEGLGAEVIHVATDAVVFGSSVVTTAVAVAGVVGSGGGSTATLVEEIRHLIGNGLELGGSSVDLMKAIYIQEPFYEGGNPDAPETHPPYIGLEIADIFLSAAALGVNFEEMTPEDVAEVLLQSLNVAIPVIQDMQTGDLDVDQHVDIALQISHVIVEASLALVRDGEISEDLAWRLAARTVEAAQDFSQLPEIRDIPELKHLPLALLVAQVTVDIGQTLRFGDTLDIATLVDLTDQILTMTCQNPEVVMPLFEALDMPTADVMNVMATSQTVFDALNKEELFRGEMTPQQAVSEVLLPMIDGFVEGDAAGACAGLVRYDPYDAEVRALLRVARQVLRLADVPAAGSIEEVDHRAMLEWSIATVYETMQAIEVLEPGTIDERVLAGVTNFGDAVKEMDPNQPPATQMLRFSHTMMPSVKDAVAAIPDLDPVAPKVVDVLDASLEAAIPLTDGQIDDVAVWLDGSLKVVNAVQELPLRADARAGLGIASRALELSRDGARGTLTPPRLVRGAQEIVELLRFHLEEGDLQSGDLFASTDPALLLPAQGVGEEDLIRSLAVSSAVLDALADTLEEGRLTIPAVQKLLERVTVALAPTFGFQARGAGSSAMLAAERGGFESLSAAVSALPILDPTVPVEEATEAVLLALLEEEENATDDPAVIAAVQAARGALSAPAERVVNVLRADLRDIGTYDQERSDRFVDLEGGVRTWHVKTVPGLVGTIFEIFLEAEYPVGHSRFPLGLHDMTRMEGNENENPIIDKIRGMEDRLVEIATPEFREYALEGGSKVRFEKRFEQDMQSQFAIGIVISDEPVEGSEFVNHVVRETQVAPQRLTQIAEVAGPILEARFEDPATGIRKHYDADSGRLRIAHTRGDKAGTTEIRGIETGLLYTSTAQIPDGGQLLAYIGRHPQNENWIVEYRRGANEVLVWEGKSYDRLEIDSGLQIDGGPQIPLDGKLIERRFHAGDHDWLYRPGVHALKIDACANWEIHALGPLVDNETVPDPASPFSFVGDLLARGDAFGGIERGDGTPMTASAAEALRLKTSDQGVVLLNLKGDTSMLASSGILLLAPGSRRELELSACSEGSVGSLRTHRAPNGDKVRERTVDGTAVDRQVSSSAEIARSRTIAGQVTTYTRQGALRRVEVRPRDVEDPFDAVGEISQTFDLEQACSIDNATIQRFVYDGHAPLFVSAAKGAPLFAPPLGDPRRARKILFFNKLEEARQKLAVFPSVNASRDLLDEVHDSNHRGRVQRGLGARANRAVAAALNTVARGPLAEMDRLEGAGDLEMQGWLDSGDPTTPFDELLRTVGAAQEANLTISPEVLGGLTRAFPQIGVNEHPLEKMFARVAADQQASCYDDDTRLRTLGVYGLAIGWVRNDACGGSNLLPKIQLGLTQLAESQNGCLDFLKDESLPPAHFVSRTVRDMFDRMTFAAELDLDADPQMSSLAELTQTQMQGLEAELDENRLKTMSDRQAQEAIRAALEGAAQAASTGGSEENLLSVVPNATGFLADRVEKRLNDRLAECDLSAVAGCDVDTLDGCSLKTLPDCSPDAVTDLAVKSMNFGAGASATGSERSIDFATTERGIEIGIIGALDEAERAAQLKDGLAMVEAVRRAWKIRTELMVFNPESSAGQSAIESRIRSLASVMKQELEESNPDDDGHDSYDEYIYAALGAVGMAHEMRLDGGQLPALRQLVQAQIPALLARDTNRLQQALDQPVHPAAKIDALLRRIETTAARDAQLDGLADVAGAGRRELESRAMPAFLAALDAHPDRGFVRPNIAVELIVHHGSQPLNPYTRLALKALMSRPQPPVNGRQRAADLFLDHAQRFDPDQKGHRLALMRLIREVEQIHLQQRESAGLGPVTAAEFEQDPLLQALQSISLRLGDIAAAKRFGIYGKEQAEREAQRFVASAEQAEAALTEALQKQDQDPRLIAALQKELARRQELAGYTAEEAARRANPPAGDEFGEVELVQELERLASDDPLLVETAAKTGRLLTPRRLTITISDRFEAMAAELEPVDDRAGAYGRLAHRLAANLPSPEDSSEIVVRLAAIPQLAGFLVEETGLISPASRGGSHPLQAIPAGGIGTRSAMPAANGDSAWDPRHLLEEILKLTQVRPGKTGPQVAQLAEALLKELGQDTDDPLMRAGLTVTSAGVEGTVAALIPAAQGEEPDWLDVIDAATESLASIYEPGGPPEDFWLGLAGRMTQVGLQVIRDGGSEEAAATAAMQLAFDFLEYPDVDAVVQQIPEPGGQMIELVKGMMGESMQNIADGDSFDIALARVVSEASFAQVPEPYGPFGNDMTGWALDFVNEHRAEIDAAIADRENPEAWRGVTAALLQADGIPTLTCVVNEHIEGVEVPPGVALLPFIGGHELLGSPELFQGEDEEKALAMLDVGAGLMNLWLSGAVQGTCENPVGVSAEDTPFAAQVRSLKTMDTDDPMIAFNLLGRFGLAAVDTLAPGTTMARALNTVWWGQETAPPEGVPFIGLGSALTGEVDDAIEVAMATPKIAGDVVAILAEDPALEKTMDLLGGNCQPAYMLSPDVCRPNTPGKNEGTLPNLLLATLADFRRQIKPGLTDQQHYNHSQWGYMRTLPALNGYAGGFDDISGTGDAASMLASVDLVKNLEQSTVKMQKAGMAAVDVARMAINVLNSLPTVDNNGLSAQHIQNSSVFVEQVGGEMFSGVAGGLMREWELGTDPEDADVYFELVGQFVIPALVRSAAQFTYQNQGDDWMMMIRAGSNYPDLTAVGEQIGVAIPANEIASVLLGKSDSHLSGWMGVADEQPYFQLYSDTSYSIGSQTFSQMTMSGFANDFGGTGSFEEQMADLDFGVCAEVEQALLPAGNPYASLFTMGASPKITLGGFMFKQDATFGAGFKMGASTDFSVPVFPIAGVEIGADFGSGFEATYDGDWFPETQLNTCIRPFINANFFGIQLQDLSADLDVAVFGDMDADSSEVGVKMKVDIGGEYYDLMRENIGCDAPGPLELPLCFLIDTSGEDLGAWMTLTDQAVYFGLGTFPENGDTVLAAPFMADGSIGLPGLYPVEGWGGFSASPFDLCADDMCGSRDSPPPGAAIRSQPSVEGE